MKISECNAHQQAAWRLMIESYNDIVGGWENTLLDYPEDSEYYKGAYNSLHDHDYLKETVYDDTIQEANRRGYAKHIRFAGKEFLMERIEKKMCKDGY